MECADSKDLVLFERQQGEVAVEIDIGAPILDHWTLSDPMLDEEEFRWRNCGEKGQKAVLVLGFQRAKFGSQVSIKGCGFRKFVEKEVERHKRSWFLGLDNSAPVGEYMQLETGHGWDLVARCLSIRSESFIR
jgi:hypothetical protein